MTMKIGEVAAGAGVGVETLRYYERRGLLEEPARTASGYRAYEPEAVGLVRFIKRAQDLGFTLNEIREQHTPSRIALHDGQLFVADPAGDRVLELAMSRR